MIVMLLYLRGIVLRYEGLDQNRKDLCERENVRQGPGVVRPGQTHRAAWDCDDFRDWI